MSDTVVVMSRGRSSRSAPPSTSTTSPRTPSWPTSSGRATSGRHHAGGLQGLLLRPDLPCLDKDFGKNVPWTWWSAPEDVDIVPVEQGQLTGLVTSVTFMGVHYEIIVDVGGFKWMIQTTDFVDVDERIGIQLEPDAIHIMKKSEYSDLYGDYSPSPTS